MAKYYVSCGSVRRAVHRETREHAARDVVMAELASGDGRLLHVSAAMHMGLVTSVSEEGFKSRRAIYYPTYWIFLGEGPFMEQSDRGSGPS